MPLFIMFVSVLGFVHFYFRAGRLWLGAAACGLRALALILNFRSATNVNFERVTAMLPTHLWGGESIYLPVGVPNPNALVAQLSNLLLLCFIADASLSLWRRGGTEARRRAVVGASMVFSFLATALLAGLLNAGLVPVPAMLSVFFLVVVVAMAYELGWDVIAAAGLTARLRASEESLRESEQRLQLAAGARRARVVGMECGAR